MNDTMLRLQAVQFAQARVKPDATTEDLLAEAEKILVWLTSGHGLPSATQHESNAAVAGQGPKSEG